MDRCEACGAALVPGAAWCGQCFAPGRAAQPVGTTASAFGRVVTPLRGVPAGLGVLPAEVALPPSVRRTRWQKTPTTFGPVGRVLATVGVVVPLVLMIVGGLADPFVWGGAGLWGVVIMPWALRDIWKAGQAAIS